MEIQAGISLLLALVFISFLAFLAIESWIDDIKQTAWMHTAWKLKAAREELERIKGEYIRSDRLSHQYGIKRLNY